MQKFGTKRSLLIAVLLVLLGVALSMAVALPGTALGVDSSQPLTLQQINDVMSGELSGQKALENVAYVYRGWRNTGGPWFNQVETWIQSQLGGMGFTSGENSSDFSYWIQSDYRTGSVWVPQYLSMQIVGPEGDADPLNPTAYHFDHPAIDTFDPTSPYYPASMTQQWVIDNQRTPAEEAINDRCHLATSSAFTSPMNTDLTSAEASATVADVVDVGTVTGSGTATRTWSKHSTTPLAGKILFSSTASISSLMTLASQQSAKAVMSSSALSNYSDPVIDGVEVYPNNVRFAGGGSSAAPTRVTLNISRDDVRFLTALCAQYDLTSSFPQMKIIAIGSSVPYSVAPDTTTMLRTLIVEIKGTTKADERIMQMAHIQEPGAEDNASGVGQQLEMLRATKALIDSGALPRPRRTMTFMWGNEMTMSALYKASHPAEYNKIVAAFSNDMVGADQATTGAVYVLDKMPDPSARYKYQTDVLAGTTPAAPTQFLRGPDTHTLWGAGNLTWYPYAGHFLNDLYFESGKLMEQSSPTFDTRYRLKPSPWEGGSDAQPFLWNSDVVGGVTVRNPIPALATFFFTDYTYHSSMDTMKSVSAQRLRDVGLMSGVFAYYRADADLKSAGETVDIVQAAAHQRFGWEKDNSTSHFLWALLHPYGTPATTDAALHEAYAGTGNTSTRSIGETQLLSEWGTWYQQAVSSARTMFAAADNTPAYDAHEAEALAAVAADATEAQAHAARLLAVSHFSTTTVAINDGAEWTTSPDVTLTLAASSVAPGGVTGMRFSDDGVTWPATFQAYSTSAAYSVPLGGGMKTVYAQFQDSEGNVSDPVQATIKLEDPALLVGAPNSGSFTQNDATTVSWHINGATSAGTFQVWLKNTVTNAWVRVTPGASPVAAAPGETAYNVPWTVTQPVGTYKLWVRYYATDGTTVLASAASSGTISIGLKATPTITTPNSGSFTQGAASTVSWSMSNAVSSGSFRVWLKNTVTGAFVRVTPAASPVAAAPGETAYSVPWNVTQAAGTYKLWVYYYAADGSVSSTAVSSGVVSIVLKPTPAITSPNSGSITRGNSTPITWSMSSAVSSGSFRVWLKNTVTNAFVRVTPAASPIAAVSGQTAYSVSWFVTQPVGTYKLWVYYYLANGTVSTTAVSSGTITLL